MDNEIVLVSENAVQSTLDRARPTLLSKLRNLRSDQGIPDELANGVTTYLLLKPEDGEVRQARDRLISSTDQPNKDRFGRVTYSVAPL